MLSRWKNFNRIAACNLRLIFGSYDMTSGILLKYGRLLVGFGLALREENH